MGADRFKRILARARGRAGTLGLRPNRVYLREGHWTGDYSGDGTEAVVETEITESGQPPKVTTIDDERRAISDLPGGSVEIGPVTPLHSTGGTDLALLIGTDLDSHNTFHLRIVGPAGDHLYRPTSVKTHEALHYTIVAVPVSAETS